jgi:transmembrane sensor
LGEREYVELRDGSVVELNSETRIVVNYSSDKRSITLQTGEVLFNVKHDSTRPFTVRTGRSVIEDAGTVFDVYRRPHSRPYSTLISMVEGRIRIRLPAVAAPHTGLDESRTRTGSAWSSPAPPEFGAGQQVELSEETGAIHVLPALTEQDLLRRLAWCDGRVKFENTPLSDAVEQFNRYHPQKIKLANAALGSKYRVSATFEIGIVSDFLAAMREQLDLRYTESLGPDGNPVFTLFAPPAKTPPKKSPK